MPQQLLQELHSLALAEGGNCLDLEQQLRGKSLTMFFLFQQWVPDLPNSTKWISL